MAPSCSCGCGRRVYESYVRRKQAFCEGGLCLASVACASRLATKRPHLRLQIWAMLARGPLYGHGCGPRRRAVARVAGVDVETSADDTAL